MLYKITRVTKILQWLVWRGHLNCCFIYGLIVVIIVHFLMGHILGCRIVAYFQFVLDLRVPLPWFFIIISFFIVNHIYIIILECYNGWLPSQTCWPSTGYFSLVQEDPQISVLWGLAGSVATAFMAKYVGLFWGVRQCPWVVACVMSICLGLGDLLSLESLSE